jgi:hypothetical protein
MPYLTDVFAPVLLNDSEPVVVYAKDYLQKVSDLIASTNKRLESLPSPAFHSFILMMDNAL